MLAYIAYPAWLKPQIVPFVPIREWGDMLVAGIPLGYTFGRLGNFINGELYGRITKVPWGIVFPNAEGFPAKDPWVKDFAAAVGVPVPAEGLVNLPRHPSQLYEAFFEGPVLWLVLWFIVRKRKPYKGFVIAGYLLGYAIVRFFIEYLRQPDQGIGFPITLRTAQQSGFPVQSLQFCDRSDPEPSDDGLRPGLDRGAERRISHGKARGGIETNELPQVAKEAGGIAARS